MLTESYNVHISLFLYDVHISLFLYDVHISLFLYDVHISLFLYDAYRIFSYSFTEMTIYMKTLL